MKEIIYNKYKDIVREILDSGIKFKSEDIPKDIPNVFIPGYGKDYNNQNKKILYIGKDTNGWDCFRESLEMYRIKGNEDIVIRNIINRASDHIEAERHIEWWNNGKSQFWDFIFKLQMKINKIDIEKINKDFLCGNNKTTQGFAWGNCNILQQNIPKDIRKNIIYKEMRKIVDKEQIISEDRFKILQAMLESFNPDIIVILNWQEGISFIGEYIGEKKTYIDDISDNKKEDKNIKIEYYRLKSGQRVFWTYHPRGMISRGGVNRWVNALYEFMKNEELV